MPAESGNGSRAPTTARRTPRSRHPYPAAPTATDALCAAKKKMKTARGVVGARGRAVARASAAAQRALYRAHAAAKRQKPRCTARAAGTSHRPTRETCRGERRGGKNAAAKPLPALLPPSSVARTSSYERRCAFFQNTSADCTPHRANWGEGGDGAGCRGALRSRARPPSQPALSSTHHRDVKDLGGVLDLGVVGVLAGGGERRKASFVFPFLFSLSQGPANAPPPTRHPSTPPSRCPLTVCTPR
jgi:hypothetical protein